MIDKKNIIKHILQKRDALLLCQIRMKLLPGDQNRESLKETLNTDAARITKSILSESTVLIKSLEENLKNKQENHEIALKLENLIESISTLHDEITDNLESFSKKPTPVDNKFNELLNKLCDLASDVCCDWGKIIDYIDDKINLTQVKEIYCMINKKNIIKHILQNRDALLLCQIRMKLLPGDQNRKSLKETLNTDAARITKSILSESTALIKSLEENLKNKQENHEIALKLENLIESISTLHDEITDNLESFIKEPTPVDNKFNELLNKLCDLASNVCCDWGKIIDYIDDKINITQVALDNTSKNTGSSLRK